MLALSQFTVVLDFMILSPLGAILMKTMKLTPNQFGTVVSAYAFSAGISGILAAGFADKYDRKKLLMFFYTGFILGTLFCGLANSYETLLLARIVTGIFGGVVGSISMAIVTDLFALQQRGRVMGYIQMTFAASQILGLPIGISLANAYGWHSTFYMVVILAALIAIAIALKMLPITEHLKLQTQKNAFAHLFNTIRKRHYRIGFLATALLSMGGFMIMPFASNFTVNNIHIPMESLPTIYLCTGLASVIIMPVIGRLSDKIDKFKLFTAGSILACIMVVVYTNLTPIPLWQLIAVNMILFMGIMSRMVPAMALNSAVPDMADRGAYMSINSSLQQMAGGIAAVCAGLIVVQRGENSPIENFNIVGYVMVASVLLCIFLIYRVSEMIKKKAKAAGN